MQIAGAFTGRRVGAYVAVGAVLLGSAACNRGSDSGPAGNGKSSVRIAIVTRDFTNPYWAAMRDGAIDEGKKQGVTVNVQAGETETDSAGENAKISTLAVQNYNCFGVVPVNATNVITPLAPVAKKKTPILNLDTQIDPKASKAAGVSYASFIGSDNLQAGRIAGTELLKKVKGGDVAILQGIAGEQNGINREKGFAAATSGKLNVVAKQPADYDQSKGQTVTEGILRAHPNIKGVFAANDTMGLGAARAIENAGKKGKIPVVSIDGITAALKAVKSGQLDGTVTQYPYAEGQMAVQACIRLAAKKTVPSRIVAPIALIGKDDASKALASFPKPFKPFDNPLAGTKAGG
jgi:ribose transport system substrate-binding protein